MKFKIILFVLFTLSYSIGFGQVKNKKPIKMKYVPNDMILCVPAPEDSLKPFYISNHLTTNKEYFTFLLWMYSVCKSDQRKYYLEYLPEDEGILLELFHQDYSNKPVLGLSKKQIIAYCQWRTAILNEYILVKQKFTNKKIKIPGNLEYKFGLETFVLHENYYRYLDSKTQWSWTLKDSILYEQYLPLKWNSEYLYPNFRLPLENELLYAKNIQKEILSKKLQTNESILNIYDLLKKNWNDRLKYNPLKEKIEFLIDLRINTKEISRKRRFEHFEICELVFNDSNQTNFSFFQKSKISKIKNCTEKDRFGNLYSKCNLFLIDEENAKPVFIKYDEYLKCFDNVISFNCKTAYSNYSGFRCVMFAPGY